MSVPYATAVAVPAAPPSAPQTALAREPSHRNVDLSEQQVTQMQGYLAEEGFPKGLQKVVIDAHKRFPLRIWIVDNSGSMSVGDGKQLKRISSTKYKMVSSSRWAELRDSVLFHGNLGAGTRAPTEFRLLNPPTGGNQVVVVGRNLPGPQSAADISLLKATMNSGPGGGTPLCSHIRYVHDLLSADANNLRQHGQKAVLVLATDGQSTDGDLAIALKSLERLPIWVVIRLCTDEDSIVDYYNEIDGQLELDMDVLDDLEGEAKEVTDLNPWLVYGLPLHRAREFGIHTKLFDLLDERQFTTGEMREFCSLLLGMELPHPDVDWGVFESQLSQSLAENPNIYDPITKKVVPWINIKKLRKCYGKGGCVIS